MQNDDYSTPWYSLDWFTPSRLNSFTWEYKWVLFLIAAVPVLFVLRWLIRLRFNQKLPVAVMAKEVSTSWLNLVRLIPEILIMAVLSLLLMGLARPQTSNEKVDQW